MTEAWPLLSGRLEGAHHILPVRIYFEDTDFSGVVYHGSYVRFMERGRTDFLRLVGIGHDASIGVTMEDFPASGSPSRCGGWRSNS